MSETLIQEKKKRGPPFRFESRRAVTVSMDLDTEAKAYAIGAGNISAGIRAAVRSKRLPRIVPAWPWPKGCA